MEGNKIDAINEYIDNTEERLLIEYQEYVELMASHNVEIYPFEVWKQMRRLGH